jgi:uncharacterized protein (DUF58 family)
MSEIPILLLLLLAIAVLLRLDFVFYLIYVLAGTYALAQWWTARSLPRLRVSRHFTDHVFLGETVQVEIRVENTSWWPVPWLRYDEAPPSDLIIGGGIRQVVSMRPGERVHLRYELTGWRRGYYPIGPARLTTGDLFGFAEASGSFSQVDYLTVYPRVIPLTRVPLTSCAPYGTIKSREPIFADPTRIIGVRDYRPGDPLRSVDWKSSARAGNLQVRKHEPAVSLTSVIFLDLNSEAYSRQLRYNASEWAIVVAASLANYLTGQRQAVGLACNGTDSLTGATCWSIPPRPGRTHLMKLLEWLARARLAEKLPLADWLPMAALDLAWGTTAVVITPTGGETICRALHRLLRSGLNPVLVVIEPHSQFGIIRERGRRLGISAHLIADERDLDHWRNGRPMGAAT